MSTGQFPQGIKLSLLITYSVLVTSKMNQYYNVLYMYVFTILLAMLRVCSSGNGATFVGSGMCFESSSSSVLLVLDEGSEPKSLRCGIALSSLLSKYKYFNLQYLNFNNNSQYIINFLNPANMANVVVSVNLLSSNHNFSNIGKLSNS